MAAVVLNCKTVQVYLIKWPQSIQGHLKSPITNSKAQQYAISYLINLA